MWLELAENRGLNKMKPPPSIPFIPGNTSWERLDNAVRTIFKVPKDALMKEEKRQKKIRQKKRAKKKAE